MTDKKTHLDKFVNDVYTTGDTASYKEYLKLAMKEYVEKIRAPKPTKTQVFMEQLNEFIKDAPIQFDGDNVLVNGKVVARLVNDLDDMENDMHLEFPSGLKLPVQSAEHAYKLIKDKFLNGSNSQL